jgi:thioredoxin 1/putative thioredoxin
MPAGDHVEKFLPHLDGLPRPRIDPHIMTIFGRHGSKGPGGGARAETAGGGGPAYVTERDFEAQVLGSDIPVLLEFTADWCQPCKAIAPDVQSFAEEMRGKVKVLKVDIDKSPVIAQQLRVQSVPTFMVVAEGRIANGVVGAIRKKKMLELVEPYLPRAEGALKPGELAKLISARAVQAIDTREPAAFTRAHLPGAINIPLEQIESRLGELHMVRGQPVVYCRSGDKAKELADRLSSQGMPVAFLEGGLLAWEADGLPIDR